MHFFKKIETPFYLIKEEKLLHNLEIVEKLRNLSGAKILLATKCFATWATFPFLKKYLDGTTSSSYFELLLGHQKFGKEKHIYSVGYTIEDMKKIIKIADKVIFNSISQYLNYRYFVPPQKAALRINPEISYSPYDLADPARPYSRLGEISSTKIDVFASELDGVMFHFNCDNNVFEALQKNIKQIEYSYKNVFEKVNWVSFGGGISFTSNGYPVEKLAFLLKELSLRYNIQIYLEPGEAIVNQAAQLVTTIIDTLKIKGKNILIINSSVEAHMPDALIYGEQPKMVGTNNKLRGFQYTIAGNSCLAGDEFGSYFFNEPLSMGDQVIIDNAGGYTMVKKNWFNGLHMPSIVIEKLNGEKKLIRDFNYRDYKRSLS